MQQLAPGLVLTVSSNNIEDNVATVTDALRSPGLDPTTYRCSTR